MKISLACVERYFPEFSDETVQQLTRFVTGLLEWNTRINLISRKDTEQIEVHHLLSSLAIVKGISLPAGANIIDIGTGGGLPGIPLAICFPECHFHLVDSIGKKIKVVQDLINQLGLTNATAEQARAENLNRSFDFVTGRAVTALERFLPLARPILKKGQCGGHPRGILYLKGQEIHQELETLHLAATQLTPLSDWYSETFFDLKYFVHIPSDEILNGQE